MASNTPVFSYDKLMETQSYQQQREVIQNEVNTFVAARKIGGTHYAPFTIADNLRICNVNYAEFKKTTVEKQTLKLRKSEWKKQQKAKFGRDWTKRKASKPQFLELHIKI